MLIVWGARLYGKVDEVPGLCHVATKFGHLWYIPLIPMGSHLIVEETDDGWRGIDIGLNLKSILMAWLRTGVLAGFVGTLFWAIATLPDNRATFVDWISPVGISISLLAAFIMTKTKMVQMASYRRACELAKQLGLPEEARDSLKAMYGIRSQR